MHEVSVVEKLLDVVEENKISNKLDHILKVVLKIGTLTCIEEKSLRFAFDALSVHRGMKETKLEIESIQATALCGNCGKVFEIDFFQRSCPQCNRFSHEILTGYEILLDRLEGVEEGEHETDFGKKGSIGIE